MRTNNKRREIHGLRDLCALVGTQYDNENLPKTQRLLARQVWSNAPYCTFVEFLNDGVEVGASVKGTAEAVAPRHLTYPFTQEEWEKTIGEIDRESDVFASLLEEEARGRR